MPPMYSGAGVNPLPAVYGVLTLFGFACYGLALVRVGLKWTGLTSILLSSINPVEVVGHRDASPTLLLLCAVHSRRSPTVSNESAKTNIIPGRRHFLSLRPHSHPASAPIPSPTANVTATERSGSRLIRYAASSTRSSAA